MNLVIRDREFNKYGKEWCRFIGKILLIDVSVLIIFYIYRFAKYTK